MKGKRSQKGEKIQGIFSVNSKKMNQEESRHKFFCHCDPDEMSGEACLAPDRQSHNFGDIAI